jgi:hypothetical protein
VSSDFWPLGVSLPLTGSNSRGWRSIVNGFLAFSQLSS